MKQNKSSRETKEWTRQREKRMGGLWSREHKSVSRNLNIKNKRSRKKTSNEKKDTKEKGKRKCKMKQ